MDNHQRFHIAVLRCWLDIERDGPKAIALHDPFISDV